MRDKDEQKRARILNSVSEMISEAGVASVSLSKIAKRAGIASGTMYTYFADKDDMLRQLYLDRNAQLAAAITQIDPQGDPKKELLHFMELTYQYSRTHLVEVQLIREFVETPLLQSLKITPTEMYAGYENLSDLVKNGVAKGVFEPINFAVLMAFAYTPTVEYAIAASNQESNVEQVPFTTIQRLVTKAILK